MNLRDLEYFVAVAEEEHFGKAAHRCFVSQPTLSGQLKKLEEELQGPLFERDSRNVKLTPLGEEVLVQARQILAGAQRILELGKSQADPLQGPLLIGAFPTMAPWWIPRIAPRLQKAMPKVQFLFHELKTPELVQRLREGTLDAAFVAEPDGAAFPGERIGFETFELLVPQKHALAKRKTVKSEELQGMELLLLEEGHCLRDEILDLCRRFGANEKGIYRATGLETLRQTIRLGTGVTLVPRLSVEEGAGEGLRSIPFQDPPPGRFISMHWRATHPRQQALRLVAQIARDWAGEAL